MHYSRNIKHVYCDGGSRSCKVPRALSGMGNWCRDRQMWVSLVFAGLQAITENFFTGRIDHKFSDMDSINGTYLYDDTDFHDPDSFDNQLIGSHTKRQIIGLEENHIFSSRLVNTVRVGYNREYAANNHSVSAINPAAADPTLGSNPGGNASDVRITGVGELLGGLNSLSSYFYHWNSIQAYDDASFTFGKHSLKFGFAVERIRLNMLGLSNPGGVWSFGSLSSFLTNNPSKYTSGFVNTLTPRGYRESVFGAYIQDDWRVLPKLTVNLGLRYEPTTVFSEVSGKITNLPNLTSATPTTGGPLFQNPTLRNFAPRVGFAWDPFGNGKTAVRGGFGLFDVLPLPYQFVIADVVAAPFFRAGAINKPGTGTFFTGGTPLLGATSAQGAYFQNNPKRDYIMQWNLNVQREVTPNLTATVGYVGSHGVHEPFRTEEFDNVTPQLTSAGYLVPLHTPTLNPNFGTIKGSIYDSSSSYNALWKSGIPEKEWATACKRKAPSPGRRVSMTIQRLSPEISFRTRSRLFGTGSIQVLARLSRISMFRALWSSM